ncbi:MAG: zeta toxin family protein [Candidatus Doudnabacteria bacterium]
MRTNLNPEEKYISDKAVDFIKNQKAILHEKFASKENYSPSRAPVSVFLAGSPGAGKTEFSKRFFGNPVLIDADAIREIIPQYEGYNASIFQAACALGVEKLYDYVLKNKQHVILDATFANYEKSLSNVRRSLSKSRKVEVFYIYQDPKISWDFTQKREKIEKRHVPLDVFIDSFISARENVNKIKSNFKKEIKLNLIHRNYLKIDQERYFFDIDNVDKHIPDKYSKDELLRLLE